MRFSRGWDKEGKRNRLYGRRWRGQRAVFLAANPLCVMCQSLGRIEPATVVDHKVPHRGDEALFWDQGNWQSLCEDHHNGQKAREEIRGYSDRLGDDGWPLDPMHPANCGHQPMSGKSKPDELLPIAVRVFLVCGSPAAGKSTWCREQMRDGDLLIDFDDIDREINGKSRRRGRLLVPVLRERNTRLLAASKRTSGRIFLPMTAARSVDREWWRAKLGNVVVVLLETDLATCLARVDEDEIRHATADDMRQAIRDWFERFDDRGIDLVVSGRGASQSREPSGRPPSANRSSHLVSDVFPPFSEDFSQNSSEKDDLGFA